MAVWMELLKPEERLMNLGIDFGSTYSSFAVYNTVTGSTELCKPTHSESEAVPSVACLDENDRILTGHEAREMIQDDEDVVGFDAFKMLLLEKDEAVIRSRGFNKNYTPEKITEHFLNQQVKKILSGRNERKVDHMVVCVPETWLTGKAADENLPDGRAVMQKIVSHIANVEDVQIVGEATATCACFTEHYRKLTGKALSGHVLVIDCGGGTLDLTLAEIVPHETDGSMEIVIKNRTGAGENHPGKIGDAGIAYMESVVRLAVAESPSTHIAEPSELDARDPEFRKAYLNLERRLKAQTTMGTAVVSDGEDVADGSVLYHAVMDHIDDINALEEAQDRFTTIRYRRRKVDVTFSQLMRAYNQVVAGRLQDCLKDMTDWMDEEGIDYEDSQNDRFHVVVVGGFGKYILVRNQIQEFFEESSTGDRRFDYDLGENREYAVAIGAALLAEGVVRIDHDRPMPERKRILGAGTEERASENINTSPLLRRVFLFLEDGDWTKADEYCERVLDQEPENALAYLAKLMVEMRVRLQEDLANCEQPFDESSNYRKAIRFGGAELSSTLEGYIRQIRERSEAARVTDQESGATDATDSADSEAADRSFESNEQEHRKRAEQERSESNRERLAKVRDQLHKYQGILVADLTCTVGLRADGTVVATRYHGPEEDYDGQCEVSDWQNIRTVATQYDHTVGLKPDGTVVSTRFKPGSQYNRSEYSDISYWKNIVAVEPSLNSLFGLKANGTVTFIGSEFLFGQTVGWTNITAISADWDHVVGLRTDGSVVAAGDNEFGQCNVSDWTDIVAVTTDFRRTIGLKADGTVISTVPEENALFTVPEWQDIVAISANRSTTVGLKADGTVIAAYYGKDDPNSYNQCNVTGWTGIVAIAAGGCHTVGLRSDGTVVATEYTGDSENDYGQCDVSGWDLSFSKGKEPEVYAEACSRQETNTEEELQWAAYLFSLLNDYRDSAERMNTCDKRYREMITARKAAEHMALEQLAETREMIRPYQGLIAAGERYSTGVKENGTVVKTRYKYPLLFDDRYNDVAAKAVAEWRDIIAVADNNFYSLGLKSDGTVVTTWREAQPLVSEWRDIVAIAMAENHLVGLRSNGTVVAADVYKDPDDSHGECEVSGWTDIVAIAAGNEHTVGLKADGSVVATAYKGAWSDYLGQCDVSNWSNIVAIAAGCYHTVGLKSDGTVISTYNYLKEDGLDSWEDIVAVSAGAGHTVGLKADGTVMSTEHFEGSEWNCGQCDVSGWKDIVAVSAGYYHTLGAHADGTIVSTQLTGSSSNDYGQCEVDGWKLFRPVTERKAEREAKEQAEREAKERAEREAKEQAEREAKEQAEREAKEQTEREAKEQTEREAKEQIEREAKEQAEGEAKEQAEREAKERAERVAKEQAELEQRRKTIERLAAVREKIISVQNMISAGSVHTVGLRADGTVIAMGSNLNGQCDVSDWREIIAVSAGSDHTIGLRSDGTVVAAGRNDEGQCNVTDWHDIIAISGGDEHSIGLRSDGTIAATGKNDTGQCNVSDWQDIVAVSAGDHHSVGLRSDGRVVAAGDNQYGQCDVSAWQDIIAVSAGLAHTIGLRCDGTVVAVGYNQNGRCDVSGWQDIVAVAASGNFTIGLRSDGTVVAAGAKMEYYHGECDVSAWRDIVAVAVGAFHTIGLCSDGTVVSTGYNKHSQCNVEGWKLFGSFETLEEERKAAPDRAEQDRRSAVERTELERRKAADRAEWERQCAEWERQRAEQERREAAERAARLAPVREKIKPYQGLISAGLNFSAGVMGDGTVVLTEDKFWGKKRTLRWKKIITVAPAGDYLFGLRRDGKVEITALYPSSIPSNLKRIVSKWRDIIAIAAYGYTSSSSHLIGLKANGTVTAVTWGDDEENKYGQCDVSGWTDIIAIATGFSLTAGLTSDGRVVTTMKEHQHIVSGWRNIVSISEHAGHIVGLKTDGTLVATNNSHFGLDQCAAWEDIVAISGGKEHVVGLKADGTVLSASYCHSSKYGLTLPWHDIVAVSAGDYGALGLHADGTVESWVLPVPDDMMFTEWWPDEGQYHVSSWKLFN